MSGGDPIAPIASWQWLISLLGALGLGGVLTALAQRPSRRAVEATAARDQAAGSAEVIEATASAFTEVTSALRQEIERLQAEGVRHQAALQAALERVVELEGIVGRLTNELERVRSERDEARALVDLLRGELAQLKQVMASTGRAEAKGGTP